MGPNERRAKADQTHQEAMRIIDAEKEASRAKTKRLKAERLDRDAAAAAAEPEKKTKAAPKRKPKAG